MNYIIPAEEGTQDATPVHITCLYRKALYLGLRSISIPGNVQSMLTNRYSEEDCCNYYYCCSPGWEEKDGHRRSTDLTKEDVNLNPTFFLFCIYCPSFPRETIYCGIDDEETHLDDEAESQS